MGADFFFQVIHIAVLRIPFTWKRRTYTFRKMYGKGVIQMFALLQTVLSRPSGFPSHPVEGKRRVQAAPFPDIDDLQGGLFSELDRRFRLPAPLAVLRLPRL